MQESVPQWDPIPVEHHMTWEIRLFVFFVLFVLVFFLIRATQLTWFFLRARKQLRGLPTGQALAASAKEIPSDIRTASIRAASLKRGAVFTFLLSLLASVDPVVRVLSDLSRVQYLSYVIFYQSLLEGLTFFVLGVGTSALLYCGFALSEGRLARVKLVVDENITTG